MKPTLQNLVSLLRIQMIVLLLAATGSIAPWKATAGSINEMTTVLPANFSPGHMLLLSDGRVMVQDSGGSNWCILSPDDQGHYIDGNWNTNCPPMHDTRLYGASDVLTDGRVFIAGAEYGTGGATAEVFNPQANGGIGFWTYVNPPASLLNPTELDWNSTGAFQAFLDSVSVVLPDGNVLIAPVNPSYGGETLIYNPFTNGWSAGGSVLSCSGNQDECNWVKLPDDSILTIDNCSDRATYATSERYVPASNTWVPVENAAGYMWSSNWEIGAGFLLINGTVLFFGGNNETEIYTPSPLGGTNSGSWTPGPNMPSHSGQPLGMRDCPGCTLNNGKLLLSFNANAPNGDQPSYLYEFDPGTREFNLVFTNNTTISDETSMLQLPDGNVLFSDTAHIYVYQPDPSPISAGQPSIQSVSWNTDGSLHLTGTLFNGISQGAMYGDEYQQDSNYPLVRFTDGSGNVTYGRTYNWSSSSVQTGGKVVTTETTVPSAVLDFPGQWSLQVVANGNASLGVTFYSPVWVDFNLDSVIQIGWYSFPYYTLPQGVSDIAGSYPGGTIAIRGDVQPSLGHETVPYTISTPMTIISVYGPSTIGN